MAEIRSFVVTVSFLMIFSLLVGFVPTVIFGGGGLGGIPPVAGLDPAVLSGYQYTKSIRTNSTYFSASYLLGVAHHYSLGDTSFIMHTYQEWPQFRLGVKSLVFGVWVGGVDWLRFRAKASGADRGDTLSLDEIQYDYQTGGQPVRYQLIGRAGVGDLLCTWDTTLYSTAASAAAANSLYFIHGIGVGEVGSMNVLSFLLSILTFRAPNIHPAINALIAVPIYAVVGYLFLVILEKFKPL